MVNFVAHDLYYIKSDAFINAFFLIRIIERRPANTPLLHSRHRFGGRPKPVLRACFYLAEYDGAAILKYDVDFPAAYAVISFEYGAAVLFKICRSLFFAAVTPFAHVHPISFFKNDMR